MKDMTLSFTVSDPSRLKASTARILLGTHTLLSFEGLSRVWDRPAMLQDEDHLSAAFSSFSANQTPSKG